MVLLSPNNQLKSRKSQSENFLFAVIDFSISSSICRSAEFLRGNFFTSEHEFSWRERDVCKFSIASLNSLYMAES